MQFHSENYARPLRVKPICRPARAVALSCRPLRSRELGSSLSKQEVDTVPARRIPSIGRAEGAPLVQCLALDDAHQPVRFPLL
jgi:hypothetical protein